MAEIIHDYNYAQVLTLDLLRKGCIFEEVPIRYRLREHGKSFISWRYPARVLPAIWRESWLLRGSRLFRPVNLYPSVRHQPHLAKSIDVLQRISGHIH